MNNLKEIKGINSLAIHFFTRYRFEYYVKKEKLNIILVGELSLDL